MQYIVMASYGGVEDFAFQEVFETLDEAEAYIEVQWEYDDSMEYRIDMYELVKRGEIYRSPTHNSGE